MSEVHWKNGETEKVLAKWAIFEYKSVDEAFEAVKSSFKEINPKLVPSGFVGEGEYRAGDLFSVLEKEKRTGILRKKQEFIEEKHYNETISVKKCGDSVFLKLELYSEGMSGEMFEPIIYNLKIKKILEKKENLK